MVDLRRLRRIAEEDFSDIVESTDIVRDKLRVLLHDGSYGRGPISMEKFTAMTTCPIRSGLRSELSLNTFIAGVSKRLLKAAFHLIQRRDCVSSSNLLGRL